MTSRAGQGLGPRCRWTASAPSAAAGRSTRSAIPPPAVGVFTSLLRPRKCLYLILYPTGLDFFCLLPAASLHWRLLLTGWCCPPPPLPPLVPTLFSFSMSGIDQQVTGDVGGHTSLPGRAASPPMDMPGRRVTSGHQEGEHSNISYLRIENGMGSGPSGGERGDMRVGTPDQTLTDHLDKVRGAGGLGCGRGCGRRVYALIRLAVDFRRSGCSLRHAGAEQQLRVHQTLAADLTNVHCACLTSHPPRLASSTL